ncbi:MAG TPA: hypothetical protein VMG60_16055 [Burkholderiaceae bacterium]|nr:hypothetical protein [Burkholderiaceae bacterium]
MLRRTKSRWFARNRPRDPASIASAVAFTSWRVALESIKRMRAARFSIDADARYFVFLREFLVFLIQVADRLVAPRCDLATRAEFLTVLCHRLGELLAENQAELLGGDAMALRRAFIDLVNERAEDYATFGFDQNGPDFAFARYCAHQLLGEADETDQAWLVDQIVAIEAPAAIDTLRPLVDNLVATAPGSAIT